MATTFARLCQQVDITQKNLENEIARLSKEIDQLENIQSNSRQLRWVWGGLAVNKFREARARCYFQWKWGRRGGRRMCRNTFPLLVTGQLWLS